ncbi:hypothetical protein RRG08_041995 [Elysia crispata]|uniref:Uncharacterized protein n=1 Tax=Elysia crispata TaxID=231223 RepID=A0AAE1D7C1_9GAST|nr:hypothetical protein RRG08_041995 [Elysia crispata]
MPTSGCDLIMHDNEAILDDIEAVNCCVNRNRVTCSNTDLLSELWLWSKLSCRLGETKFGSGSSEERLNNGFKGMTYDPDSSRGLSEVSCYYLKGECFSSRVSTGDGSIFYQSCVITEPCSQGVPHSTAGHPPLIIWREFSPQLITVMSLAPAGFKLHLSTPVRKTVNIRLYRPDLLETVLARARLASACLATRVAAAHAQTSLSFVNDRGANLRQSESELWLKSRTKKQE